MAENGVRELVYTVPEASGGATVQTFLRKSCGVSARLLTRLKRVEQGITADGEHIRSVDRLRAGQTVRLRLPADAVRVEGADLPLTVVYEDESVLAVDKPPYLAVHPSAGHAEPTLAAAVIAHFELKGNAFAFRPVNRLDRNTSGLLLAAKNPHAAHLLSDHTNQLPCFHTICDVLRYACNQRNLTFDYRCQHDNCRPQLIF